MGNSTIHFKRLQQVLSSTTAFPKDEVADVKKKVEERFADRFERIDVSDLRALRDEVYAPAQKQASGQIKILDLLIGCLEANAARTVSQPAKAENPEESGSSAPKSATEAAPGSTSKAGEVAPLTPKAQRVVEAARTAHDVRAISDRIFERLRDGTVSWQDLDWANSLWLTKETRPWDLWMYEIDWTDEITAEMNTAINGLADAVRARKDEQGFWKTLGESVKDMIRPGKRDAR